jgi:hypothetical protein
MDLIAAINLVINVQFVQRAFNFSNNVHINFRINLHYYQN